jgi:hypothetical protein
MGRLVLTDKPRKRLHVEDSLTRKRLSPELLATSLGAEPAGTVAKGGNPFAAYLLREELFRRLRSSGGRPGLDGAEIRPKVPMRREQWRILGGIAKSVETETFHPTPTQVASILLDVAIERFTQDTFDLAAHQEGGSKTKARR